MQMKSSHRAALYYFHKDKDYSSRAKSLLSVQALNQEVEYTATKDKAPHSELMK